MKIYVTATAALLALMLVLSACAKETDSTQAQTSVSENRQAVEPHKASDTSADLPDQATKVEFSTMIIDKGDGPELCLGGVAESLPPQCSGPVAEGLTMAPGWAETASGVTFGERTVTVSWPAVDNRLTVLAEREYTVDSSNDIDRFPLPEACKELTPDTSVDVEELSNWADNNLDKAGIAYFHRFEGSPIPKEGEPEQRQEGVGVLQVIEEHVEEARLQLNVNGRTPCIDEVSFSMTELRKAQQQISEASQKDVDLYIPMMSSGNAKNRVEVAVVVADASSIREIESLVDDPTIVDVEGIGKILE